jgi:hypothetical protein
MDSSLITPIGTVQVPAPGVLSTTVINCSRGLRKAPGANCADAVTGMSAIVMHTSAELTNKKYNTLGRLQLRIACLSEKSLLRALLM